MTENTLVNYTTGEIVPRETIVEETENFMIIRDEHGKYRKQMKYKRVWTKLPENEQEKIEMYRVMNDSDNNSELVTSMANAVGKQIEIHQSFTNPYTSFDEDTGKNDYGVTTTIYDGKHYYATSSKSVYYTLEGLYEVFGQPTDLNYKPIKVEITSTKMQNGNQIGFKLIGL